MWLLEADTHVLGGRRIWLRPGKLYLFGRTASEPGQLAISHKTISRRHMTMQVDVADGDSQRVSSRSTLTIEDLATKSGTTVDGYKFKGEKFVVSEPAVRIQLGSSPDSFRLSWHPVVLAFSFTNRALQTDTIDRLRYRLEQLDIKFSLDYKVDHTTHVISKKRNTSKGLQALINGKHIVTDAFVDALEAATTIPEGSKPTEGSALEDDFDGNWPDPLQYLPPRGGEPVERPNSAYAPDESRREVFEGYTFIFYDNNQYDTLLAPITNGKGKALYTEVKPAETSVDDFIRFVKTEAGEKGLGSFEDGSEGRGVVVVRFIPAKGEHIDWYSRFFTEVSQRLDHRPIEQNEFLEAILINNASILRRALEVDPVEDTPPRPQAKVPSVQRHEASMDVDQRASAQSSEPTSALSVPPPRRRPRKAPTRRFAGFDDSSDEDVKESIFPDVSQPAPLPDSQEALFVSQEVEPMAVDDPAPFSRATRSQRKRPADHSALMDEIAPNAAAAKRRRIEAGEDPVPRRVVTEAIVEEVEEHKKETKPQKKIKKEIDVLEEARKRRELLEAQAKAEKEDLARLPADVDFEAIRQNHVIEYMAVGASRKEPRTREQDIADGRWDPKWNGRKNFKAFRQRGTPNGRPTPKVIVPLKEAKKKDFGIGDDYWLEDDRQKKKDRDTQKSTLASVVPESPVRSLARTTQRVVLSDDSDDEVVVEETPELATGRTRATRGTRSTATQSQRTAVTSSTSQSTRQTTQSKRPAEGSATSEPPAKKARPARKVVEVPDSDESDDGELKFKFGRRRKK